MQLNRTCVCCGRSNFSVNSYSQNWAEKSWWRRKYGYSVSTPKFRKILSKIEAKGLNELIDFNHFLRLRLKLYQGKNKKNPDNINNIFSDTLPKTEHHIDSVERRIVLLKNKVTNPSIVKKIPVKKFHQIIFNNDMRLWICEKCETYSETKSELEKSSCTS